MDQKKVASQSVTFLRALAPETANWTFQTFDDGKGKRSTLARVLHGSFDQLRTQLLELNRQGAGVFVTVNETDGKGRKADNVTRVRAVFADFDNPAPGTLERLRADPLPPSIIVESSRGKLHAYWLADGLPLEQFKQLQQRIAASWGSDPAVCDLPRVMRLPGFEHRKGDPCPVKLLEVAGHRYDALALIQRYAPAPQAVEAPRSPAGVSAGAMTPYASAALGRAVQNVGAAVKGTRNNTLNREAFGLAQLAAAGELSETIARDMLVSAAQIAGLPRAEAERTLRSAFEAGMQQPRGTPTRPAQSNLAEYDVKAAWAGGSNFWQLPDGSLLQAGAPAATEGVQFSELANGITSARALAEVDLSDVMTAKVEPVQYAVEPWLPRRHVALFGGHGGIGKSILMLIIAAHVAVGLPFAGRPVEQSRVLFVSLEDEGSIVKWRLARIIEAYSLPIDRVLANLRVVDGTESFSALVTSDDGPGGTGRPIFTPTFREMANHATGAGLIVIDNASDAFDANENARRDVRMFIRGLGAVARYNNAAVVVVAHIDKAAAREGGRGNHYSGSTAWHNSCRSRLALVQQDGAIQLLHEKNNLGPKAEPLEIAFTDCVPMPVKGTVCIDGQTSEDFDQEAILCALKVAREVGINVPASLSPGAHSAMKALELLPEYVQTFRGKVGGQRAACAITELIRVGRIRRVEYKNSHRHTRERLELVELPEGGAELVERAPIPSAQSALRRPPITPQRIGAAHEDACASAPNIIGAAPDTIGAIGAKENALGLFTCNRSENENAEYF